MYVAIMQERESRMPRWSKWAAAGDELRRRGTLSTIHGGIPAGWRKRKVAAVDSGFKSKYLRSMLVRRE